MRRSAAAYFRVPMVSASRMSAECVAGRKLRRHSRYVETRQKNIPAFQKYLPEDT